MGVISFGDGRPVWGSSASLIRGLVETAIATHGRKDYLLHLNYTMEWMYNHLDMTELHVDELKEFATAIPSYRASYVATPGLQQATIDGAGRLLDELMTMLELYIHERKTKEAFEVERDFWTLCSVQAEQALDEIHHEGNIDLTFFGQLLLFVSYDSNWDGTTRSLGKSDDQSFGDALALAEYLVSTNEFWAGCGMRQDDGTFESVIFDNFESFRQLVRQQFTDGLRDMHNPDLTFGAWVLKKLPPREERPLIPDHIKALFGEGR